MHRRTYLTAALAAWAVLLIVSASASAAVSASVAESLRIADRYWGPHPCAGKVQVVYDSTLKERQHAGEASGMALEWTGVVWQWIVRDCRISVQPGRTPEYECEIITHEVGHLALVTAEHTGRMAPESIKPAECLRNAGVSLQVSGRVRRTRRQIARRMRYKRQMAKLRAKAYARGTAK